MTGALALPTLCIFNTGPLPSLYNQVIALIFWGGLVNAIQADEAGSLWGQKVVALGEWLCALCVLSVCAIGSVFATRLPIGLAVANVAFLFAAAVVAVMGSAASSSPASTEWTRPFVWAVFIGATLNCIPAILQAFRPDWIDGTLLAPALSSARLSGNVRQPNLLATLCACGIAAAVTLIDLRRLHASVAIAATVVMLATIAGSGSRIGAAEVVVLAAWALVDNRLNLSTRKALFATPFALVACWLLLQWWSHTSGLAHAREPDLATVRYVFWQQCLTMISMHPWLGVGMGNLNFAWTLTPFARLNPATFDNAHNLLLQWAVELGIPVTLMLLGLFGRSLWHCLRRTLQTSGDDSTIRRFSLVFIVLLLLHSLTEYPLWYAYFLLPVAFAWGIAAAPPASTAIGGTVNAAISVSNSKSRWLDASGLLIALSAALAAFDYQKIVDLYHPWYAAPSLEERIDAARQAMLYGYLADRFAGTLAVNGTRTLEPYIRATRQMLDMRLLIAWSLAMRESGDIDRARYLAQRVKDFNHPISKHFFDRCVASAPGAPTLWQCTGPQRQYTYEDFL